jgi:hypothetical protein
MKVYDTRLDHDKIDYIVNIISDNWVSGMQQSDKISDRESVLLMKEKIHKRFNIALECNGLVLLVYPETQWIGRVHIYSSNHKFDYISAGKSIFKHLFETTCVNLIYGYSPEKRFVKTIERGGMDFVGILPNCHKKGEEFVDNYVFCVQREKFSQFLLENPIPE